MLQRLWEAQPRTSASARRAITLHGTHPKESRTDVHTETCTWMFLEGVVVIASARRQPRPFGKWMGEPWSVRHRKGVS